MRAITVQRLKRLTKYVIAGSFVGLLGYLAFYLLEQPFRQNWITVVAVGVAANMLTSGTSWLWAYFTDKSKIYIQDATEKHRQVSREITENLLKEYSNIESWAFVDSLDISTKELFAQHWKDAVTAVLDDLLGQPFKASYETLSTLMVEFETCKQEYIQIAKDTATAMGALYKARDANLKALADVSAEIKEEAILPSFTTFEKRMAIFTETLTALEALKFV